MDRGVSGAKAMHRHVLHLLEDGATRLEIKDSMAGPFLSLFRLLLIGPVLLKMRQHEQVHAEDQLINREKLQLATHGGSQPAGRQ